MALPARTVTALQIYMLYMFDSVEIMYRFRKGELLELWDRHIGDATARFFLQDSHNIVAKGAVV